MASAPFSDRFKSKDAPKQEMSVEDAIKAFEGKAKTPQQQALVKSLRNSFSGEAAVRPAVRSDSPGMKAARQHMPSGLTQSAKSQPQPQSAKGQSHSD